MMYIENIHIYIYIYKIYMLDIAGRPEYVFRMSYRIRDLAVSLFLIDNSYKYEFT